MTDLELAIRYPIYKYVEPKHQPEHVNKIVKRVIETIERKCYDNREEEY